MCHRFLSPRPTSEEGEQDCSDEEDKGAEYSDCRSSSAEKDNEPPLDIHSSNEPNDQDALQKSYDDEDVSESATHRVVRIP